MIDGPRNLLLLALAAALVVAPGTASAELAKPKDAQALHHFEDANKLYRVREFDKAIEEYKKSLLVEESTAGWYNIAQAHRQLGHYDEAIWYYRRLLDRGKLSAAEKARIQGLVDAMEAEKAQAARSKPPIEPGPDKSLGEPLEQDGGSAVDAPDHHPSPATRFDVPRDAEPWYADRLGWTLTGSGLIVGVVGIGFLFNAASLRSDAEREPTASERDRLRDLADNRQKLGIGLGVAGGALLVGGVIKLTLAPSARKDTGAGPRLGVACGPSWFGLQGRF